jgi:hypothetical protein
MSTGYLTALEPNGMHASLLASIARDVELMITRDYCWCKAKLTSAKL